MQAPYVARSRLDFPCNIIEHIFLSSLELINSRATIKGVYRANGMNWTELPVRSLCRVRAKQRNWTEISVKFSSVLTIGCTRHSTTRKASWAYAVCSLRVAAARQAKYNADSRYNGVKQYSDETMSNAHIPRVVVGVTTSPHGQPASQPAHCTASSNLYCSIDLYRNELH